MALASPQRLAKPENRGLALGTTMRLQEEAKRSSASPAAALLLCAVIVLNRLPDPVLTQSRSRTAPPSGIPLAQDLAEKNRDRRIT